jgi:hypothetical protein
MSTILLGSSRYNFNKLYFSRSVIFYEANIFDTNLDIVGLCFPVALISAPLAPAANAFS